MDTAPCCPMVRTVAGPHVWTPLQGAQSRAGEADREPADKQLPLQWAEGQGRLVGWALWPLCSPESALPQLSGPTGPALWLPDTERGVCSDGNRSLPSLPRKLDGILAGPQQAGEPTTC